MGSVLEDTKLYAELRKVQGEGGRLRRILFRSYREDVFDREIHRTLQTEPEAERAHFCATADAGFDER